MTATWSLYWTSLGSILLSLGFAAVLCLLVGFVTEFVKMLAGQKAARIAGTLAMLVAVGVFVAVIGSRVLNL